MSMEASRAPEDTYLPTSIYYAPWDSTPTCPLKSFPGPPEPTTFHGENDFGRSYSFSAINSKNPTSTHANVMIYGIFSDQLLHSIINDGSSTEARATPCHCHPENGTMWTQNENRRGPAMHKKNYCGGRSQGHDKVPPCH